jgi:hypothetical protein
MEAENQVPADDNQVVITIILDEETGAITLAPASKPIDMRMVLGIIDIAKVQLEMQYLARAEYNVANSKPKIYTAPASILKS